MNQTLYWKDYLESSLPEEEEWSGTTVTGIRLDLGVLLRCAESDSTSDFIELNDTTVHGAIVGAAGSGKSRLLDCILAGLFHRYPPEELSVEIFDMKGVDLSTTFECGKPANISFIASGKDLDILKLRLKHLQEEQRRRLSVYAEFGIVSYKDARLLVDFITLPRILVVIDEWQELCKDEAVREKLIVLLKLARVTGMHFLLSTQSYSNEQDIMDLFRLRIMLGCNSELAMDFLGTVTPPNSIGIAYTNIDGGRSKSSVRKWRFPYIIRTEVNEYVERFSHKMLSKRLRR